jgi:hypothetical protein
MSNNQKEYFSYQKKLSHYTKSRSFPFLINFLLLITEIFFPVRMSRFFLVLVIISIFSSPIQAQRCATEISAHQSRVFEKWIKDKVSEPAILFRKEKNTYQIPVVVHVIHQGEEVGNGTNISDEQIRSQIEVLNEDFNRLNADTIYTPELFSDVAANPEIEFVLAYQDPNRSDTTGITRTYGGTFSWNAAERNDRTKLKSIIMWPAEDYLNIWVTDLSGTYLGQSQFPEAGILPGIDPPLFPEQDGIIIDYKAFGSAARIDSLNLYHYYNLGRTTTHEVGYFLGLLHIWGEGGCGSDDFCEDTPPQAFESSSCPKLDSISCGTRDMYENFMDYTYDECMNLFTGIRFPAFILY